MIEHLRSIESNKNGVAPIFASWEWQHYYKYKMCSVAIHKDELWITLRIPIVNLAEQWIRAIPTSNQLWISETLSSMGYKNSLFKSKIADIFMVLTENNLEICDKLGFSRVCTVRKAKFKEFDPFVVPIDVSHGRVLVISNSTYESLEIKSVCDSSTKTMKVNGHSMLKIPEKCTVIAKSFEVSKMAVADDISVNNKIGEIETILLRQVARNRSSFHAHSISDLPKLSTKFDINNNATTKELDKIVTKWDTGSIITASSSATSVILLLMLLLILILKCLQKYRSSKEIIIKMNENDKYESNDIEAQHIPLNNPKENAELAVENAMNDQNRDAKKENENVGLGPKFRR